MPQKIQFIPLLYIFMISLRRKTRKERFAHYDRKEKVFLMEEKRATFLKQYGYPRRKRAKKGFLIEGLTRFFFFLIMYLIGRQEEMKCCLLYVDLFIRGFV